jgi:nucleoside-diphosphate-sugar epimerase
MKAIVTGAGGFVGANLVRYLLADGHEPHAVVRPAGNVWRLADVSGDAPQVAVDLRDPVAVERVVRDLRPDVIFHLAAHGAYSWQKDLDAMLSVNVRATEALLVAARDVGASLVHAGSSSEYGYQDHAPHENERVNPNSHYALTKVAATHLCRLAASTGDMQAVTLRLYSIYGPWEEPGRLMPTLVHRAAAGGWPPLVGPEIARDFVWVDDACDAFVRAGTTALGDRGAVINIASGIQTTLEGLVGTARRVLRVPVEPAWGSMPARSWDTSIWVGDPGLAEQLLGWKASTTLGAGLERMAAWFDEHPELAARYETSTT